MPDHGLRFAGSGRRVSHPAPNAPTTHTKRQVPGCDKSLEPASHASQEQAASHLVIGLGGQVGCPSAEYSGFWREGYVSTLVSSVSQAAALPPPRTMDHGPWVWLALPPYRLTPSEPCRGSIDLGR